MSYPSGNKSRFKLREADRVHVDVSASLVFANGGELPVTVTDLSSCGFSCRSADRLPIGSQVNLQVPDAGEFLATIVWQLGDHAGARFEPPLAVNRVMSIIIAAIQDQRTNVSSSLADGNP